MDNLFRRFDIPEDILKALDEEGIVTHIIPAGKVKTKNHAEQILAVGK